jgi:hypothetical protein
MGLFAKICAGIAVEIVLLVTPMMWPSIPAWLGYLAYSAAGLLLVTAAVMLIAELRRRDRKAADLAERVSNQEDFPVAHAACLLARQDLATGMPTGLAAGYFEDIRADLLSGRIRPICKEADRALLEFSNIAPNAAGIDQDKLVLGMKVSRADLAALARRKSIVIPGLTEAVAPAPQSPLDTAKETQR